MSFKIIKPLALVMTELISVGFTIKCAQCQDNCMWLILFYLRLVMLFIYQLQWQDPLILKRKLELLHSSNKLVSGFLRWHSFQFGLADITKIELKLSKPKAMILALCTIYWEESVRQIKLINSHIAPPSKASVNSTFTLHSYLIHIFTSTTSSFVNHNHL